ncbi:hypothetical protein [Leptobacterium sp. I13]|uniref:hypothetical protein n=1 Tax=Leptobacterium meishanense TaxID=3128904 RepID=UPI0030ED288A
MRTIMENLFKNYFLFLCILFLGCEKDDDPTVPTDYPDPKKFEVSEYVEWIASAPDEKQVSKFFYDEGGNVISYEFSSNDDNTTLRVEFEYNNGLLNKSTTYGIFENEEIKTIETTYFYREGSNKPHRVHRSKLNILTNTYSEGEIQYEYDRQGRVKRILDSGSVTEFTYGQNTLTEKLISDNTLIYEYKLSEYLNPFSGLPPFFGNIYLFNMHRTVYLTNEWEAREPNKEPASMGSFNFVLDSENRPIRIEHSLVNSSTPNLPPSLFITEIKYR